MSFARTRRHADYYTSTSLLTTIVAGLLECSMPRLNLLPKPSKLGESFGGVIEWIFSCEHPKCVIVSARWTTVLKTPEDSSVRIGCAIGCPRVSRGAGGALGGQYRSFIQPRDASGMRSRGRSRRSIRVESIGRPSPRAAGGERQPVGVQRLSRTNVPSTWSSRPTRSSRKPGSNCQRA